MKSYLITSHPNEHGTSSKAVLTSKALADPVMTEISK